MPRLPRSRRRTSQPVRLVVRFPNSTEVRDADTVPAPGTRLRSASGVEAFVVEALQSGANVYTVWCLPRRQFLERQERGFARAAIALDEVRERAGGLDEMAADLVKAAAQTARDHGLHGEKLSFVASFTSADGRLYEDLILARSFAGARAQALDRARAWQMTVSEVRPAPEWARVHARKRRRWLARLLPRR